MTNVKTSIEPFLKVIDIRQCSTESNDLLVMNILKVNT